VLAAPVKNVVLVQVLSSMARAGNLSDILIKDGYNLILVQEPLTSLEVDVAASKP
jgi:hypothetical protein